MRPTRSKRIRGLTLVELIIGVFVGVVVLLAAGSIYLVASRSFGVGSKKLLAQREATLLSTTINRRIRVGSRYQIYNVPDRTVAVDSGNGIAISDAAGALLGRLEWSSTLHTLVDSSGTPVTSMRVQKLPGLLMFKKDPVQPRTVGYRYQVQAYPDSNKVDIQSCVSLRNWSP